MERALRSIFDTFASPVTVVTLGLALIGFLAFGVVVPQVTAEQLTLSYPSALAHVIDPLQLGDAFHSWLFRALALMLVLSLAARGLERWLTGAASAASAAHLGRNAFVATAPAVDVALQDLLRTAVPRAPVRLEPKGVVSASRGLTAEGALVLALGVILLAVAPALTGPSLTGRLFIVDGLDPIASSRSRAERLDGGDFIPWKPDFGMACAPATEGAALGPRQCTLTLLGQRVGAALEPGKDLEFLNYRLSFVGARRLSDVAGAMVTVTHPDGTAGKTVGAGDTIDLTVPGAKGPTFTAMVGTLGRHDPLGLLVGPGGTLDGATRASATVVPRTELELAIQTTAHWPYVAGGLALLLVGIVLMVAWPGYRVTLERRGADVVVTVRGVGAFTNSEAVAKGVAAHIAARSEQAST